MNRGIYPILSGAMAQERQIQIFANNVANVNTTGFKQDHALFHSLLAGRGMAASSWGAADLLGQPMVRMDGVPERVFSAPPTVTTGFEPGRIRTTGNPLDLAIQGPGFFEIQTAQGTRYTRNGIFHLDTQRRLVTDLGDRVMGLRGPLNLPPGLVEITAQGSIQVDGTEVGRLKIVDFPAERDPVKVDGGLFSGATPTVVKSVNLAPGHIEESNVNVVGEMVNMIQGMRTYEAAQKLIQTFDRMMELAVQDIGKVA